MRRTKAFLCHVRFSKTQSKLPVTAVAFLSFCLEDNGNATLAISEQPSVRVVGPVLCPAAGRAS